jgi:hypothetical protein
VLFNANTVEMVLLFCAVLVCLMGLMFEAIALSGAEYYGDARRRWTELRTGDGMAAMRKTCAQPA